jgi:chemotaxis protein MotB
MIKRTSILLVVLVVISSCVSPKVYKELEGKYSNLKKENRKLESENDELTKQKELLLNDLSAMSKKYDDVLTKRDKLEAELNALKVNYENLNNSYNALEENSSAAIAKNAKKNRELLAQLEAKEQALATENERLKKLEKNLAERSNRVNELESLIAAKDQAMRNLKDAVSRALTDFEGKGLTVEQRDGKVYVSMENKLLFSSGSWAVGVEGKKAVEQLGAVLADNPEIAILIEGHTDNVPYTGNGQLKGNWDLSTKRATSIVEILKANDNIKPENLTAAGRGEYAPIATNETGEGRAKNRRIEVILTPKLDEITKLLNEI